MPGACCYYGVCCPPGRQATAMAEALGIPLDAAQAVAGTSKGTGHVLVPRALPPVAAGENEDRERVAAFRAAAQQRLDRLHRQVKAEMKAILIDLGYGTDEAED